METCFSRAWASTKSAAREDDLADRRRLRPKLARPPEIEEPGHHPLDPVDLHPEKLEELARLVVLGVERTLEKLRRAPEHAERRSHLVCDSGGQLADEGELRRIDQLALGAAKIDRHAVERGSERADLVARTEPDDRRRSAAGAADRLGRGGQLGQRSGHAPRRDEGDRQRGEERSRERRAEQRRRPVDGSECLGEGLRHDHPPRRQDVRKTGGAEEHSRRGIDAAGRRRIVRFKQPGIERVTGLPRPARSAGAADHASARIHDQDLAVEAARHEVLAHAGDGFRRPLPVEERRQPTEL